MNRKIYSIPVPWLAVALGLTGCAATGQLDERLARLEQANQALSQRLDSIQEELGNTRHRGRLVKQVTLTEDNLLFPANSVDLTGQDVKALNALIDEIKGGAANYHVEIQGHTDESGNPEFNYILGEGRAKAVLRYLYQYGGLPLHRMSTVSYGARMPAAPGVGSNRRVEVLIYR